MIAGPKRPEIDHRTIKLVVGLIALSLAPLTSFFASSPLSSISASYWDDDNSRDIFVGFLFAICAFLLAYNGRTTLQMMLSKVAAFAAICVAMFPCDCCTHSERIPGLHAGAAAVMFAILAFFCYAFFDEARAAGHAQAKARAHIYAVCGTTIVAAIAILAIDRIANGSLCVTVVRLPFYCESAGLTAFGISWLTASLTLPVITSKAERFSPLR